MLPPRRSIVADVRTRQTAPLLVAGGAALGVASLWLAVRLAADPAWRTVDEVTRTDLHHRPGGWQLLRALAGPLGVPLVGVVLLVLLVVAWRRSRLDAGVLAGIAILGSASVQLLGPSTVPALAPLGSLSGHVGAAAAVGLGWLVVGRSRSVRPTAGLALALLGAAVVSMTLAGWHTAPQIVASVGVPAGWAVMGLAVVSRGGRRWSLPQALTAQLLLGLGGVALALVSMATHEGADSADGYASVAVTLIGGLGVVLAAVGGVLGLRMGLAASEALASGARPGHEAVTGELTGPTPATGRRP